MRWRVSTFVLTISVVTVFCGQAMAQLNEEYAYKVARYAHQIENAAVRLKNDTAAFRSDSDLVNYADKVREAASALKDRALEIPATTVGPDRDKSCLDAWKSAYNKLK